MNTIGTLTALPPAEFGSLTQPLARRPIEKLVGALSRCTSRDYCAYHARKRDNKALLLPSYIPPSATARRALIPDTSLMAAIRAMRDDDGAAGSWQLMGEQRKWFESRLNLRWHGHTQPIRIAILGVPGVTHLRETAKLLAQRLRHARHLEFFVLERCMRPLVDIATALQVRRFVDVAAPPPEARLRPLASLARGRLTFHLLPCDLARECPLADQAIDIACSHLLFSFLSRSGASMVLDNIASYLHTEGQVLLAQDATDPNLPVLREFMGRGGLGVVDCANAWNLYDLTDPLCKTLLRGEAVDITNDVILMDIRRVDRRSPAQGDWSGLYQGGD